MPEFYTWFILLDNQSEKMVKSNLKLQFLALEGAKLVII